MEDDLTLFITVLRRCLVSRIGSRRVREAHPPRERWWVPDGKWPEGQAWHELAASGEPIAMLLYQRLRQRMQLDEQDGEEGLATRRALIAAQAQLLADHCEPSLLTVLCRELKISRQ